jgi:hypothetical protein
MESLETKREKEIAEVWADEAVSRAEAYRAGKLKVVPLRQAFGFEVDLSAESIKEAEKIFRKPAL